MTSLQPCIGGLSPESNASDCPRRTNPNFNVGAHLLRSGTVESNWSDFYCSHRHSLLVPSRVRGPQAGTNPYLAVANPDVRLDVGAEIRGLVNAKGGHTLRDDVVA